MLKLIGIFILWDFYTIPFGLSLFRHILAITFQLFKLIWLAKDHWRGFSTRNAHIKSNWKWYIHLVEVSFHIHTSIYDKRHDFSFHIIILRSLISSNIPSSPAYDVLCLSLYDTPWLTPHMNVWFSGPGDFRVTYSKRNTSWTAWNRHSGSFMVDTGILLSNMKSPSREC